MEIEQLDSATKVLQYDSAFGCVKTAVRKTALYFESESNNRGKVIMPCGSGKTLFSCFLMLRELRPQRAIITVPNLLLEEQTLRVLHSQLLNDEYEFICIGSDKDIAEGLGQRIQVTTSSEEITSFLYKNTNKKVIVMATYQSMAAVCYSCQEIDFNFNLGIIDEAHRTVGGEDKMFSKILFDKNIQIDKRLFMTATEKVYNGKKDEIIGMNNIKHYGETIYSYPLADAIEKDKILCDYEINEMYSSDDEIFAFIKSNSYLDYENIELSDNDKQGLLCALLATIQAIRQLGCKKIVTYHSTIKKATIFKELLEKIIGNKMLDIGVFHVNGKQPVGSRTENMEDFKSSFISVLTNSQALVEGIDIPCIDCVVFADKKESATQIVQAVGRTLRKYEGKNKSYVIVPVLTSSTGEVSSSDFSGLLSILMQMSIQDDRLLQEITSIKDGKSNRSISKILQNNIPFDSRLKDELLRFNKSVQLRVVQKIKGGWTKENCIEEAKKYKTRKEWNVKSKNSYAASCYHGWLDECCTHMIQIKKPNNYWTKEICITDAKKYKTRKEWQSKSQSYYLAAGRLGCRDECCTHMEEDRKLSGYWTKEICITDAKKYKTRSEWRLKSGSGMEAARVKGWINDCCAHMENRFKFTKKLCIEDAKKYKIRSEWHLKSSGAYGAASRYGWLDECCSHMTEIKKPNGYWTKDRCIEDAKKYKNQKEWVAKSSSSKTVATRNGWLDECCKHM